MSRTLTSLLIIIIAIRFWLLLDLEPYVIAAASHDDALFVNQAFQLARGAWLGSFNELTLIKGIGFPIFLAINYYLGLPALITLHVVFLVALLLIGHALFKFGLRPLLAFLFIIFAFYHPAFVTIDAARITRDFFYAVLLSLWIAGLLLFILEYKSPFIKIFIAIFSSIIYAWLLITREEGIWLIPFLIFYILFLIWKRNLLSLRKYEVTTLIVFHFFFAFFIRTAIASVNNLVYKERIITEFQDSAFKSAYASLLRPNNFPFRQYVPVSKAKREALYAVSPSFAELKPFLEEPISHWITPGCSYISPCDDYSSHFIWAFREAVLRAGHYSSLSKAKAFYLKLNNEIDIACEQGKLSCSSNSKSFAPAFNSFYLKPAISSFWKGIKKISLSEVLPAFNNVKPYGDNASVYKFINLIRHPGLKLSSTRIVRGWAATSSGEKLQIVIESVNFKENASFEASPDILEHFKSKVQSIEHSIYANSRFNIESTCHENCTILINSGDKLLLKYDLDRNTVISQADELEFNIESDTENIGLFKKLKKLKLQLLNNFAKTYSFLIPKFAIFICVLSIVLGIRRSYFKRSPILTFIFMSLTILIVTRLALLSYLDVTSFEGINNLYMMPVFMPFLIMLLLLTELSLPKGEQIVRQ